MDFFAFITTTPAAEPESKVPQDEGGSGTVCTIA